MSPSLIDALRFTLFAFAVVVTGACAEPIDFGAGLDAALPDAAAPPAPAPPDLGGPVATGCAPMTPGPAMIDHDPSMEWTRVLGGPDSDELQSLAFDAHGELLVTGFSRGAADYGLGRSETIGLADGFVARYGRDGRPRWALRFGGGGGVVFPTTVVAHPWGGAVIAGAYALGPVALGPVTLPAPTQSWGNGFVARLDDSGQIRWARGTGDSHVTPRVAVGPDGDVIFANETGASTIQLARFRGDDGEPRFERLFGQLSSGTETGGITAVTVDCAGEIYLVGGGACFGDLGGGPIPSCRTDMVFAARYGGIDGSHKWSRTYVGGDDRVSDAATAVVVDGEALYMAVRSEPPIDFGTGPFGEPLGSAPAQFVVRLSTTDGGLGWARAVMTLDGFDGRLAIDEGGRLLLFTSGRTGTLHTGVYLNAYDRATGALLDERRLTDVVTSNLGRLAAIDRHGHAALGWTSFGDDAWRGALLHNLGSSDAMLVHFSMP